MRNAEAERFVREVWAVFQRDGIAGVIELALPDARWRPHSAHGHRFETTDEFRAQLERLTDAGERVEAQGLGMWSHDEVVVVRGRMRVRGRRGLLEDTRMYWLFGVRGGRLAHVSSSPGCCARRATTTRSSPGRRSSRSTATRDLPSPAGDGRAGWMNHAPRAG